MKEAEHQEMRKRVQSIQLVTLSKTQHEIIEQEHIFRGFKYSIYYLTLYSHKHSRQETTVT